MDTHGKIAVVTGASRGIGAGLVRGLAKRGLRVAACARTRPEPGAFPDDRETVWFDEVDVADSEAVLGFAEAVHGRFGAPDLWINNAGVLAPIGPVRKLKPAEVQRHIAVNLGGVIHGMQAALRTWHATGHVGTVVNISSGAAQSPYEGWGAYCASKAAVDMVSRVAALEEREAGHRIHALAPGVVATEMQALIRQQTEESFPHVERFRTLHAEGGLADPESPTYAVLRLAFGDRVDEVVVDVRNTPELLAPSR